MECHGDGDRFFRTVYKYRGANDVGRVADARTMSAMVKPTQEVVESCVVVVGYGMVPRPSDCGTPVYVPFQESAGYKLEHSRRDAQALACRASLPRKRCCSPLPRTWCQPW